MFARWIRARFARFARPLLVLLARRGVGPDLLTMAGLLLSMATGLALSRGRFALAVVLMLPAGLLDSLDGAMARHLGRTEPFGDFLDSVTDHLGDLAIYVGLLWWALGAQETTAIVL